MTQYRLTSQWHPKATPENAAGRILLGMPIDHHVLQSREWIEGIQLWSDWENIETVDSMEDEPK